jgi:hypothetical protein
MDMFVIIFIVVIIGIVDASIISMICGGCETTKGKVIGSAVVILFTIFIFVNATLCAIENKRVWNDGYCECGGRWKLTAVSDTDHSSRTKYYVCDECYKEITQ